MRFVIVMLLFFVTNLCAVPINRLKVSYNSCLVDLKNAQTLGYRESSISRKYALHNEGYGVLYTGNELHMFISRGGFFKVFDFSKKCYYYTRRGLFIDRKGKLYTPEGYKLVGKIKYVRIAKSNSILDRLVRSKMLAITNIEKSKVRQKKWRYLYDIPLYMPKTINDFILYKNVFYTFKNEVKVVQPKISRSLLELSSVRVLFVLKKMRAMLLILNKSNNRFSEQFRIVNKLIFEYNKSEKNEITRKVSPHFYWLLKVYVSFLTL